MLATLEQYKNQQQNEKSQETAEPVSVWKLLAQAYLKGEVLEGVRTTLPLSMAPHTSAKISK
ncbi:MAG: hypothetical protein WCL07_03485 [bacterium]